MQALDQKYHWIYWEKKTNLGWLEPTSLALEALLEPFQQKGTKCPAKVILKEPKNNQLLFKSKFLGMTCAVEEEICFKKMIEINFQCSPSNV